MARIRDLGITSTSIYVQEAGPGGPGYDCGAKKSKKHPICQKGSTSPIVATICPPGRPSCKGQPKKTESRFNEEAVLQLRQQLETQLGT